MNPQETKFQFVYDEIKKEILDGILLPGSTLPSSRMLCDQFHVSRYTINRVFDTLREEGLIEIRPRLAPVAAKGKNGPGPSNAALEILKHRDGILQVYQTFALILPPLLVFSLQGCDVEIMPHYKQAMKVLRMRHSLGGWRLPSKLGYDILKIGGNSLFSELYSTFGLYNKLAFFIEECPCFAKHLSQNPAEQTRAVIDTWKGSDPRIMCSELSRMYQRLADSIESTLQELAGTMPEFPVQTGTPFSWNPMRGQDYYYSKIVDDLNMKIGLGEYAVGTYLPYEKQLAGRYGVSLSTVRKALSELEQRGFVKTFNGKGTVVIEPDGTKLYQLALNSGYVEKALRYLHALQLMVLVIRPAVSAAKRFTGEELDRLADRFAAPGSIPLAEIFEAIVKHTTLAPLRVILVQTNRLLGWGHHFAYYPSRQNVLSQLNKKVIDGLGQLREGNTDSFADTMADCYRAILVRVKNNLVKVYRFQDAEKIRIPQKH